MRTGTSFLQLTLIGFNEEFEYDSDEQYHYYGMILTTDGYYEYDEATYESGINKPEEERTEEEDIAIELKEFNDQRGYEPSIRQLLDSGELTPEDAIKLQRAANSAIDKVNRTYSTASLSRSELEALAVLNDLNIVMPGMDRVFDVYEKQTQEAMENVLGDRNLETYMNACDGDNTKAACGQMFRRMTELLGKEVTERGLRGRDIVNVEEKFRNFGGFFPEDGYASYNADANMIYYRDSMLRSTGSAFIAELAGHEVMGHYAHDMLENVVFDGVDRTALDYVNRSNDNFVSYSTVNKVDRRVTTFHYERIFDLYENSPHEQLARKTGDAAKEVLLMHRPNAKYNIGNR